MKGVGPKRAELFGRLGIETLEELLFYFPRKWEDRRLGAKKEHFPYVEDAPVIRGRITKVRDLYTASGLRIFKVFLETAQGEAEAEAILKASEAPKPG